MKSVTRRFAKLISSRGFEYTRLSMAHRWAGDRMLYSIGVRFVKVRSGDMRG